MTTLLYCGLVFSTQLILKEFVAYQKSLGIVLHVS